MLVSVLANISSEIIIHPTGSGRFVWRDTGTALRPISFEIPRNSPANSPLGLQGFVVLLRELRKKNAFPGRQSTTSAKNLAKSCHWRSGDSVIIVYLPAFVAPPVAPPPPSKFVRDGMAFLRSIPPVARRRILAPEEHVDIYQAGRRLYGHYGANQ